MITVRALVYTAHPQAWLRVLQSLDFTVHESDGEDWTVLASSGLVAVHAVPSDDPLAGSTELQLLVDDLDRVIQTVQDAGFIVERSLLDDGITPIVHVPTDGAARISILPDPVATIGAVPVQPIWYTPSPERAAALLGALGLTPRLASDSGDWLEFSADGGGTAAAHQREHSGVELSLTTNRPDDVAVQLQAAGLSAAVVDEAYNRTVRVTTPDRGDLSINGPIDDLHGYHRLDE
ncbi:hypothetical protein OVN20_10550 [Microcella daejeonensis]|uniref:hypothetical protein n=1 Tax=Microcella daejeonensis TaxID=2994971 RepID=UPI002271E6E8|nr:hypothetical protein [Microcella daejeonensis]WAB83491.1 hypothetical protein OVN20_10550 [Microcella daejeonensis]